MAMKTAIDGPQVSFFTIEPAPPGITGRARLTILNNGAGSEDLLNYWIVLL